MLNFKNNTAGVNDNDVIYTSKQSLVRYAEHIIQVVAGSVTVQASMDDGATWSADLAVQDLQSTNSATFVTTMTTAGNLFRIKGRFTNIRILQSGATPSNAHISHIEGEGDG